MKVTIIYDNTALKTELKADWGFSALVEAKGKNILFDTGADGRTLLLNMQKLKINPKKIEDVFISHLHWDHIGGLSAFLQVNNQVNLWVPSYFPGAKEAKFTSELKNLPGFMKEFTPQGNLKG